MVIKLVSINADYILQVDQATNNTLSQNYNYNLTLQICNNCVNKNSSLFSSHYSKRYVPEPEANFFNCL